MDIQRFHLKLLGIDKGRTPKEFWVTDLHTALYTAYEDGLHGFSTSQLHEVAFVATLVLALGLSEVINPVYFAVPKQHLKWVIAQMENVGRHIFRIRKGDKEGALVIREAFQQIRVTHKILDLEEPERWVMFGFKNEDVLPEWAKGKLLEHRELQEPLTGARATHA